MNFRFQFRRGTTAQWAAANPVLAAGEPGVDLDTREQRIGDGVTAWADLTADENRDTGTRDISSLINATTAPDLYDGWGHEATIRRIGPVVYLTFMVWSKLGTGVGTRTIEDLIPAGFRPPGYLQVPAVDASIPADLALTAGLSGAAGSGDVYLVQNRPDIADGQQWAVVASYTTPDAWPSTYPGTAV